MLGPSISLITAVQLCFGTGPTRRMRRRQCANPKLRQTMIENWVATYRRRANQPAPGRRNTTWILRGGLCHTARLFGSEAGAGLLYVRMIRTPNASCVVGLHVVVQDGPNAVSACRYYARYRAVLSRRALDTLDAIAAAAVVYAHDGCNLITGSNLHCVAIGTSRTTLVPNYNAPTRCRVA